MLEFRRKNKPTQVNNDVPISAQVELKQIRRRIGMQLGFACLTVLLAVVVLFGMTAAWYTNVVQTGTLIFEVEKLGVNVDAVVGLTSFTAKPGDEGVITLTASNDGEEIVNITVSVNKTALNDEEMQKRLFFFVEQQNTVNGETAQRTYLTASDSYTYRLFGGKELTLTETYHNASQLKWCWVYDVLGYYVLGQATEDGGVQIWEYLRPIEYDYDSATFDADGQLLTVDGTTTAMKFLTALSQTDGYEGQIDENTAVTNGYYHVDVDDEGYGIYAYLCTYAEVEANTDYDTKLGQDALNGQVAQYSVRVTVQAEVLEAETTEVSSADQLISALENGADYIKLTEDVTLSAETDIVTIAPGTQVLMDLNGQTLTMGNVTAGFEMGIDASLTISGGTLSGADTAEAFRLTGSELTLNDVTVTGYKNGIRISDYNADGQDSVVTISGCTMDLSGNGILVYGNGSASEQTTQVVIENSQLTAKGYVISGNGSVYGDGRWGTDVQIIGSTLIQDTSTGSVYAAVYQPQYGTLNIQNSQLRGYTGLVVKGGMVTIGDSYIYGVGTDPAEPVLAADGFADTADAVYVETGYGYEIQIAIQNTYMESYYNQAYRVFEEDSPVVTQSVEDNGNTFVNQSAAATED